MPFCLILFLHRFIQKQKYYNFFDKVIKLTKRITRTYPLKLVIVDTLKFCLVVLSSEFNHRYILKQIQTLFKLGY